MHMREIAKKSRSILLMIEIEGCAGFIIWKCNCGNYRNYEKYFQAREK